MRSHFPRLWTVILLAVPVSATFWIFPEGVGLPLVDARVYAIALYKWINGADVYAFTDGVNFLYPPVFLYAGGSLARFLTPSVGWIVYLALHVVAVTSLPYFLYRFYLHARDVSLPWFYWLYFAAPGFLGISSLKFGNIASICYLIMILSGALGLKHNQWTVFYFCVFVCATIKITFLPMLLLPVFCGRRQWLGAISCGAACMTGLYLQKLFVPLLYARFQQNLQLQAENMGDVGKGVFAFLFHVLHRLHHESLVLPLIGHVIVTLLVLAALLYLRQCGYNQTLPEWPALTLAGILLIMPRVNFYDLSVFVPLIYAAAIRILPIPRARLVYLCLFVISLPPMIWARDTILNGAVGSLASLVLFFLIAFKLAALPKLPARDGPSQFSPMYN
jgi:hypothetical protein